MKLPPSKMDGLLEMVGKKLGVSPEQLRSDLESGKLEQAMQNLPKKEAANVQNLLKDQKKVEQLMIWQKSCVSSPCGFGKTRSIWRSEERRVGKEV